MQLCINELRLKLGLMNIKLTKRMLMVETPKESKSQRVESLTLESSLRTFQDYSKNYINSQKVEPMTTEKKQNIILQVKKFYSSYKAREVEKILSRNTWQDEIQEFIRAKAKVDVLEASETSKSQSDRCIAYLVNNPQNRIIQFFIDNPQYKPAGLTTIAQLAYLYATDWKDKQIELLSILHTAKDTKVADRKEILNNAGFKNSPLLFLEYLLKTELNLSLFETRSKFYNGYKIKLTDVYDKKANHETSIS